MFKFSLISFSVGVYYRGNIKVQGKRYFSSKEICYSSLLRSVSSICEIFHLPWFPSSTTCNYKVNTIYRVALALLSRNPNTNSRSKELALLYVLYLFFNKYCYT